MTLLSGTAMKIVTAKEARICLEEILEAAQHEPVKISKNGRPYAVILSADHEALTVIEDAYWLKRAKNVEKESYLGPEEGERLLRDLMNARA